MDINSRVIIMSNNKKGSTFLNLATFAAAFYTAIIVSIHIKNKKSV